MTFLTHQFSEARLPFNHLPPARWLPFIFCDAFPSIHPPLNNPLPPKAFFFYAIDIYLHGEPHPLYSLYTPQLIYTSEYTSHPLADPPIFRFALDHGKAKVNFIKVKKEGCLEYLKQKLTFSCVAIDPIGIKLRGSLFTSGCTAVSATHVILGRWVKVLFETALPMPVGLSNIYTKMMKCGMELTCSWEGDGEDKLFVNFIYITMKDMNEKPLFGERWCCRNPQCYSKRGEERKKRMN
ncbi:unnamed protein product [Trifolium pratense]|uniref:Uncharacterized protein n=1 Tax=Trifolium pratense TaxID=57577 RepID=A0ACB0L607_TRIPR|nr:unnamed protein product [Trifolium pratense]